MKYLILTSISGVIVTLDQLTKMYIHIYFQVGESLVVIPGLFNITSVRNPGAAFSFLADAHPTFREIFFLTLPPIALFVILFILKKVPYQDKIQVIALSLIFGGAVGNYIDRLRFRHVIDFLDFHLNNKYVWPTFNIADICIVTGIGILILLMIRDAKQAKKS